MGLDMNQAGIDQIADENIEWLEKQEGMEKLHIIEVMRWWKENAYADRELQNAKNRIKELEMRVEELENEFAPGGWGEN